MNGPNNIEEEKKSYMSQDVFDSVHSDGKLIKPRRSIHIDVKLPLNRNDMLIQEDASEADEFKNSSKRDIFTENASEPSMVVEEEDASDLLYDKELKLLLEDHKRVAKFTMVLAIFLMAC